MLLSEELALVARDGGSGRPALGVRAELNASLAGLMVPEFVVEGFAIDGTHLAAIGKIVRTLIMESQSAAGAGAVTG
jgi:hypothetical protein